MAEVLTNASFVVDSQAAAALAGGARVGGQEELGGREVLVAR